MKTKILQLVKASIPSVLLITSISMMAAKNQKDVARTGNNQEKFFRGALVPVHLDTVPDDRVKKEGEKEINLGNMSIDEFQKAQLDLEKGMLEVEKNLKNKDWKLEEKKLKESLKKLNDGQILKEVEASLGSLKEMELNKEVDKAMLEAKKELEKSRKEMDLAKIDLGEIEKELQNAKLDMEKAKTEMKELETLLRSMKADGLINDKEDYEIEYKNDKLFINGKEQSKEVTDKYRKYFKGEQPTKIKHQKKEPIRI